MLGGPKFGGKSATGRAKKGGLEGGAYPYYPSMDVPPPTPPTTVHRKTPPAVHSALVAAYLSSFKWSYLIQWGNADEPANHGVKNQRLLG